MSINEKQEQLVEERRPRGKRNLIIVLVVCVVAIAGGAGFFVLHNANADNFNASRPSIGYTPPTPPQPLTPAYEQAVEAQIAQGLHLTTSQLKTQVSTNADGLFGVAQQQGVNDTQLSNLLIQSFQSATDKIVSAGTWTQQQGSAEMQYWKGRSSKALAGDIMAWLAA